MKHLFILNPAAGGGKKTAIARAEIAGAMASHGGRWELYETTGPMDASRKIAHDAKSGEPLRVYACGGDGTLSECVNGAVGLSHVALTHYPIGTGNDFVKLFDTGREGFYSLDALLDGRIMKIDAIGVNGRFGINICSVGIDAKIGTGVHKYRAFPLAKGKFGYLISLVANLVKGVGTDLEIGVGGKIYRQSFTLVCACNGRFYGGLFNPVPEAEPDDGLLDILLVSRVSRLRFLSLVGKYAKGRYREIPDLVTHVRDSRITIRSQEELVVNVDGEALFMKEVAFTLLPGAVNLIAPRNATFNKLDTFHFSDTKKTAVN